MRYIIQLTTPESGRVRYLKSYHGGMRARITTTRHKATGRGFATIDAAQAFIDEHSSGYGYDWTVTQ